MRIPFLTHPNGSPGCTTSVELLPEGLLRTDQFAEFTAGGQFRRRPGSNFPLAVEGFRDPNDALAPRISVRFSKLDQNWKVRVDVGCSYSGSSNTVTVSDPEQMQQILEWFETWEHWSQGKL